MRTVWLGHVVGIMGLLVVLQATGAAQTPTPVPNLAYFGPLCGLVPDDNPVIAGKSYLVQFTAFNSGSSAGPFSVKAQAGGLILSPTQTSTGLGSGSFQTFTYGPVTPGGVQTSLQFTAHFDWYHWVTESNEGDNTGWFIRTVVTPTPTPTATPIGGGMTATPTPTPTASPTATLAPPTSTNSPTSTLTPTATRTPTPSSSPTNPPTTFVPTSSPTNTPVGGLTVTPTQTATRTPSPTVSAQTATPTPTPLMSHVRSWRQFR